VSGREGQVQEDRSIPERPAGPLRRPPLAVGLDASYQLVDDHTITASDAGQNIEGT
jgi:hypothetical protein